VLLLLLLLLLLQHLNYHELLTPSFGHPNSNICRKQFHCGTISRRSTPLASCPSSSAQVLLFSPAKRVFVICDFM
jgi:hypothetical protein